MGPFFSGFHSAPKKKHENWTKFFDLKTSNGGNNTQSELNLVEFHLFCCGFTI